MKGVPMMTFRSTRSTVAVMLKCQTKRFYWQNFIRTAAYFIVRTDTIFKISPNDWHVQRDINISAGGWYASSKVKILTKLFILHGFKSIQFLWKAEGFEQTTLRLLLSYGDVKQSFQPRTKIVKQVTRNKILINYYISRRLSIIPMRHKNRHPVLHTS